MQKIEIDEIVRAEQRAYMKAWREKNRDKVKRNNAAYWLRRVEKKLQETEGDKNE